MMNALGNWNLIFHPSIVKLRTMKDVRLERYLLENRRAAFMMLWKLKINRKIFSSMRAALISSLEVDDAFHPVGYLVNVLS